MPQKFNDATGSTINEEKTKGIFYRGINASDPYVDKIKWKNEEGIEILGITFFPDYLRTINYNWMKMTNELIKNIKNIKLRNLSLKGKVLVLNTIILSKIRYLAQYTLSRKKRKD